MMRQNRLTTAVSLVFGLTLGLPAVVSAQPHVHAAMAGSRPQCEARPKNRRCGADEYLIDRLALEGLAVAMEALDSIATVDPEVRRLGHNYAHAIGLAAFTTAEEVGKIFGDCTPAFQSGCYHGVIQSYFSEHSRENGEALDPALVQALCEEQRSHTSQQWLLFQCVHGLGHGLMMTVDNHLPTALGGCDLLTDAWEREVCYGAVFMENIVSSTAPHHAVGRPETTHDAEGGSAAHDHGDHSPPTSATMREEFPPLDPERPLYPCTALEDRYTHACYQMQTSAVLHFNGRDIKDAARVCRTAPELFISTCFQSLGRDISALTVQDHRRALRLCAEVPSDFEPFCHLGYAKNVVDQTSDPADGVAFCRLLTAPASKRACYVGIGEQLWVLHTERVARLAICESVEPGYVAACRYGAAVGEAPESLETSESPEGSPRRAASADRE